MVGDEVMAAVDARAEQVACWLTERFAERDWWLDSELQFAAALSGIDLAAWRLHPAVVATGVVVLDVVVAWSDKMLAMVGPGHGEVGPADVAEDSEDVSPGV